MKTHLFSLFRLIVSVALLLAVLPGGIKSTAAARPEPPEPTGSRPGSGPQRAPDGTWYMPAGNTPPGPSPPVTAQATGGPDDFGYTWDDALVLNWIDATSGTELGMSGGATGPVSLPFSFQYYENTYTSLYIVANGYVGFTDFGWWDSQPRVPSPARPNNLIAPYATPLNLASSGPADRVYYKSGGAAPDRYFVVEWYQVRMEDEVYTFELVLHENGDVASSIRQ
jgi:hypothetical protein